MVATQYQFSFKHQEIPAGIESVTSLMDLEWSTSELTELFFGNFQL